VSTTIKVSEATRDRIKQLATSAEQTADQVVTRALDEYERALFWEEYRRAAEAERKSPHYAQIQAELAICDGALGDGLTDD
jgi:predicted transcriptional regulator